MVVVLLPQKDCPIGYSLFVEIELGMAYLPSHREDHVIWEN